MREGSAARSVVRLIAVGLTAVGIILGATPSSAQVLYGSIVGNVKDSQGAVIPGATVTIVNKETNLTRDTTTDAEGSYSLVNVLAGPYDVKISLHRVPRSRAFERPGQHRADLARRPHTRSRRSHRDGDRCVRRRAAADRQG